MDWNSWKRRWHELAEEKRNHKTQLKQEKKKQADEERKLSEIYWPRIRKVCKVFAKAIGHGYEESGGAMVGDYWIFPQSRVAIDTSYEVFIKVSLNRDRISVRRGEAAWIGELGTTEIGEIPLYEFTEEKLAQLLEKTYK